VLDSGAHQRCHMVVGEAVVDHAAVAPRVDEIAVAEQTELVADGGHRELRESCEIADAKLLGDVEGMRALSWT